MNPLKRLIPLITLCVPLVSVTAQGARAAPLPPVREAVFFGDSLTDAGTFGIRFITASGETWAQHVAAHYGQSTASNEHIDDYAQVYKGIHAAPGPDGLNYAEGGARVAWAYSQVSADTEGTPIPAQVQLKHFQAQHGSFRPDQIVMLYIGNNDVLYDYDPLNNPTLAAGLRAGKRPDAATFRSEQARVEEAGNAARQLIRDILKAGAQRLVVFELPDLGVEPWFLTAASQEFATRLTHAFNRHLVAGLHGDRRILVIRVQDFLKPLLDHPQANGFSHAANEDACREPDQDFCDAQSFAAPDADRTYVFAAAEHYTTRTQELLASHVLHRIAAHGW